MESRSNRVFFNVLLIISIIGAINWGLVGFFNWNLVNAIFGGDTHSASSALSRLIYAIVGLAGLALIVVTPWQRVAIGKTATGRRVEA